MGEIIYSKGGFDRGIFENASCAMGVFDGAHLGHQFLINTCISQAKNQGGKSIIITFDRDPDEIFHQQSFKKIYSNEKRIDLLLDFAPDCVLVLEFNSDFSALSPADFFEFVFEGTAPRDLHVGSNFNFGYKGQGGFEDLELWSRQGGTKIHLHDLVEKDGNSISATRIRTLLAKGSCEEAKCLLGRPYSVCGTVKHGRGEGEKFGFKTANLQLAKNMQVLAEGVYAATALVEGEVYPCAVNVGVAKSFTDATDANLEAHLLDFEQDIYNQEIEIFFLKYLRPQRNFLEESDLVAAIANDIVEVRAAVAKI